VREGVDGHGANGDEGIALEIVWRRPAQIRETFHTREWIATDEDLLKKSF
jgi:hypothetical protein